MPVTNDAGRRPTPDLLESIDSIDVVRWPVPAPAPAIETPAMMAGVLDLINPRRRVPGQKKVALDIAVVSEDFAESVEVEIVRVAKAMRNRFDLAALDRESKQRPCFNVANGRRRRGHMLRSKSRIIPSNQIKPAIGPFANRMPAMFTCANPKQFFRRPVSDAILIGILEPKDSAITRKIKIIAISAEAHPTFVRHGEKRCRIRQPITVPIQKFLYIPLAGDHHVARRIERHRVNVVRQLGPGKNRNAKSRRKVDSQSGYGNQIGCPRVIDHGKRHECRHQKCGEAESRDPQNGSNQGDEILAFRSTAALARCASGDAGGPGSGEPTLALQEPVLRRFDVNSRS